MRVIAWWNRDNHRPAVLRLGALHERWTGRTPAETWKAWKRLWHAEFGDAHETAPSLKPVVAQRILGFYNTALDLHGVEWASAFRPARNGCYGFSYANTGDSYGATMMLLHKSGWGREDGYFVVSSWGDELERLERNSAKFH